MRFVVSPIARALLVAHLTSTVVSLVVISIVMKSLNVEDIRVWFAWTSALTWFNATIDSGLSQCAFRRAAEAQNFSAVARDTHATLLRARVLFAPVALALLLLVVEQSWRMPLLLPTLVAVTGLVVAANWALPLFARPNHCVAMVALLQLSSLGIYWILGHRQLGILAYAWVFALVQLLTGITYAALLYAHANTATLSTASMRSALQLLRQSVPLSFASVITLPYSSAVPLVNNLMTGVELAQFAIVERVVKAVQALQVPIGQSMLPTTYALAGEGTFRLASRLHAVLRVQLLFAGASAILLCLCGGRFIELWTGKSWPGISWTIAAMSGAVMFTAATNTLAQHALIPQRRDRAVMMTVAAAGCLAGILLPIVASSGATAVSVSILFVECFVLAAYVVAWRRVCWQEAKK